MPSEEALERLDLAVRRAREAERGGSNGAGVVAALAPARVEPLAASDALGECLKPAVEDGLARDDPRRDRHTGAAQVRYAVIARAARAESASP